jgi:IS30 family transposase
MGETVGMKASFTKQKPPTERKQEGLIRQCDPTRTDLATWRRKAHRAVAAVETLLNDRPRKRLGYQTPREVITQHLAHYGVAFGS